MLTTRLQIDGAPELSARGFTVHDGLERLFSIEVVARASDAGIALAKLIGQPALFVVSTGAPVAPQGERTFTGICKRASLDKAADGLSTYSFEIVPRLWLLTQRRRFRVVQQQSAIRVARNLLAEWGIVGRSPDPETSGPMLPFKVQYGESDYAFFSRLLAEAGASFSIDDKGEVDIVVDRRATPVVRPLRFSGELVDRAETPLAFDVHLGETTRPGRVVVRDVDLRRPARAVAATASVDDRVERSLERYVYAPGSFLVGKLDGETDGTPTADDRSVMRHDDARGEEVSKLALARARIGKHLVRATSNVVDLRPGDGLTIAGHAHPGLEHEPRLLLVGLDLFGDESHVRADVSCTFADDDYRPDVTAERNRARLQTATVVGPVVRSTFDPGAPVEKVPIHVDEFGRVRVRFAWDREGESDDTAGRWIPVSQLWAGAGYGALAFPRVGHEVLVDFVGGDPEHPVVVGRLFNQTSRMIEPLPERQTRSAWKSDSVEEKSTSAEPGFNEILFEDAAGDELLFLQAQADARRLVKHDETATVVHDRGKSVGGDEEDTNLGDRTQTTKGERKERTVLDRLTVVKETRRDLVRHTATERIEQHSVQTVASDRHVLSGSKFESVAGDLDLSIGGKREEAVGGTCSLSVAQSYEESVGAYDVTAAKPNGTIHLVGGPLDGGKIVIESDSDLTAAGAGGFLRIDGGGVTIVGTLVLINEGGSPGSLPGPGATPPTAARVAEIPILPLPEVTLFENSKRDAS